MRNTELIAKFKSSNKDKKVISWWDFDDKHIVIEAAGKSLFRGQLYGVDKITGEITLYGSDPKSVAALKMKKRNFV